MEVEWEEVAAEVEEEGAMAVARTGETKAMVEHMVAMVKDMVPVMMVTGAVMIIMEEAVTEAMEATITRTTATMVNTPTGISYYVALASSRLCVLLSAAARLPLLHANVGLYIHVINSIKGVLQYMHYTFI